MFTIKEFVIIVAVIAMMGLVYLSPVIAMYAAARKPSQPPAAHFHVDSKGDEWDG